MLVRLHDAKVIMSSARYHAGDLHRAVSLLGYFSLRELIYHATHKVSLVNDIPPKRWKTDLTWSSMIVLH